MRASLSIDSCCLAPCGMNCLVCYKHLAKKPCAGCMCGGENKPESCRSCKIKDCAARHDVRHCFLCTGFPCKQVKALDKSYGMRYGVSLISCGQNAAKQGIEAFLREQTAAYTCDKCGGLISMHDGDCSECGKQYPLGRRKKTDEME